MKTRVYWDNAADWRLDERHSEASPPAINDTTPSAERRASRGNAHAAFLVLCASAMPLPPPPLGLALQLPHSTPPKRHPMPLTHRHHPAWIIHGRYIAGHSTAAVSPLRDGGDVRSRDFPDGAITQRTRLQLRRPALRILQKIRLYGTTRCVQRVSVTSAPRWGDRLVVLRLAKCGGLFRCFW